MNNAFKDSERDFFVGKKTSILPDDSLGADYAVLVVPDIHSHQRDPYAYDLLFSRVFPNLMKHYNIKKVVQLGDLLECSEFSRHGRSNIDESTMTFREEIDWSLSDFWSPIKSYFPTAQLNFVEGNHEHRSHLWVVNNITNDRLAASAIDDLDVCNVYSRFGVNCVRYGGEDPINSSIAITPKLHAIHGWSFAKHSAAVHLDKTLGSRSLVFGHTHRMQSYIRRDPFTGRLVGAWSFGALAKTSMFYQKGIPSDHCLGFGIVQVTGDAFLVSTVTIFDKVNSKERSLFLPNGEFYESR